MSQWSVTVQSIRCSLPWWWCPAHSLPGVRAQLCSISQQSATVQSRRCSIPWGWCPTHQLTWCQCTVVQHEPTERDVGFTHGVHQLGDGVQHKLLLQHALLQVLLQHWLQALQVAGILGSLGNTYYTLSLSGHTWKPGLPWYNRSGWLGVKHPSYLRGSLGDVDNTLSLFRHTWRPRQHTLYTVTVWAYLKTGQHTLHTDTVQAYFEAWATHTIYTVTVWAYLETGQYTLHTDTVQAYLED